MDLIINADQAPAGRIASFAAKELLKGKTVKIINAEKAVISGSPKYTITSIKEKMNRGDPYKGPFYPKKADAILKRMVRGMLPYKKPMGRVAFKELRVYVSVPQEFDGKKFETIPIYSGRKALSLEKLSSRL